MLHSRTAAQPFEQTCHQLEQACSLQGYGILASHNLGDTLRSEGFALADRQLRQGFAALLIGSALLTGAEAIKRHHTVLPLELQAETHRNPAGAKVRL